MDGSIDKRTIGRKRRLQAFGKENEVAAGFAILARNSKIFFNYVLVDSWFTFPIFFAKLEAADIGCIGMLKKMHNVYYLWQG
ncbi:MAG: hypothetical protein FWG10_12745 [Eubacteriaceae bacterium]|nr:hypothetical protein [Eubacteriaceae bacterium]